LGFDQAKGAGHPDAGIDAAGKILGAKTRPLSQIWTAGVIIGQKTLPPKIFGQRSRLWIVVQIYVMAQQYSELCHSPYRYTIRKLQ
jgi:hypothetical protein